MVGLLDIAPAARRVPVNGSAVDVCGISAQGIAVLLRRFPEARMIMTGNGDKIDAERIATLIPEVIPPLIAAGLGFPGDEAQEAAASRLPVETQIDLIQAIVQLTMPGGFGPFVEKLQGMGLAINSARSPKEPATTSPKASKK